MAAKVLIDVDTGTDDAIALIIALNSPELDIVGLTTVAGNASLADTTRNTLDLINHLDRGDIPVAMGSDRPLTGRFQFAYHYHGPGGLTAQLPASTARPISLTAPEFMRETSANYDGELDIIALGPLTNVARAIQGEPKMQEWVRQIVVMGGAVEVGGNVTPHAEFNIHADRRAANIVLASGIPVTLVGLDVGDRVGFGLRNADWRSERTRGERLAAEIIKGWFDIHPGRTVYVLCDPMTVAVSIKPDLFEFRQGTVTVDEEGETLGRTTAEYGDGNVRVALDVDAERARRLALDRISAGV